MPQPDDIGRVGVDGIGAAGAGAIAAVAGAGAGGGGGGGGVAGGSIFCARMKLRSFSSLLSDRAKIWLLQALQVMHASDFLLTVKRAFVLPQTGHVPWPIRLSLALMVSLSNALQFL